jgi:transposase
LLKTSTTLALWLASKVGDGNQSDKAVFAQIIQDFQSQWNLEALFVADSAF